MTPAEYNKLMSKNRLWKLMTPDNYQRGIEIQREITVDEPYETHMEFETRRELFI